MYCTVYDVRAALTPGASASDKSTASGLADWQIKDAIDEAEGIVKSHILQRYVVTEAATVVVTDPSAEPPTTETFDLAPLIVRGWTRNIAAYLATLTFKRNQDVPENDPVRLRYNMTMESLRAVLGGSLDIDELEEAPDGSNEGVHVENLYEGRLFGPEDFMLAPEGYSQFSVVRDRRVW